MDIFTQARAHFDSERHPIYPQVTSAVLLVHRGMRQFDNAWFAGHGNPLRYQVGQLAVLDMLSGLLMLDEFSKLGVVKAEWLRVVAELMVAKAWPGFDHLQVEHSEVVDEALALSAWVLDKAVYDKNEAKAHLLHLTRFAARLHVALAFEQGGLHNA